MRADHQTEGMEGTPGGRRGDRQLQQGPRHDSQEEGREETLGVGAEKEKGNHEGTEGGEAAPLRDRDRRRGWREEEGNERSADTREGLPPRTGSRGRNEG